MDIVTEKEREQARKRQVFEENAKVWNALQAHIARGEKAVEILTIINRHIEATHLQRFFSNSTLNEIRSLVEESFY